MTKSSLTKQNDHLSLSLEFPSTISSSTISTTPTTTTTTDSHHHHQYPSRFTKPNSCDQANIVSKLLLGYVLPTIITGWRQNGLDWRNLYRCPVDDEAQRATRTLQHYWTAEQWEDEPKRKKPKHNPSFIWALFRSSFHMYWLPVCLFAIIEFVIHIGQQLLLGYIIRYFDKNDHMDDDDQLLTTWLCLLALNVCELASVFIEHPAIFDTMRKGTRQRIACSTLIYQKALKLSRSSFHGETTVGQIINLISNDVNRVEDFFMIGMYLVIAPIQTIIAVYFVWQYLGICTLLGVGMIVLLFLPLQTLMGNLFSRVRLRTAKLTDTRLQYMNEIISGIRVIKMYCWEWPFGKRIAMARRAEVSQIRQSCYYKGLNLSMYFVATRIILFCCFVLFVLLGNRLTAEAVFVSMSLFNIIRFTLTLLFPDAISSGSELLVAARRIQAFLLLEERQVDESMFYHTSAMCNGDDTNEQAKIVTYNISASWIADQNVPPTLKQISVDIHPGELLAVIGPVGSGKSSFLMSLLKELPITTGRVEMCGKLAYASQEAWHFNDTVRANILFGAQYDEHRYRQVIDVCALQRDLTLMPFGDQTLVGDKGVSLSGGQKARINLARAVYRDADIILLDDPLSAVDASVAKHIFERCILQHLHARIRILVTHQIQFIERATKILVLQQGECLAYGTYEELAQRKVDFMSLLTYANEQQDKDKDGQMNNHNRTGSKDSTVSDTDENDEDDDDDTVLDEEPPIEQYHEEEKHAQGSISGRIYWVYARAGAGPALMFAVVLFTILSQALFNGSDIFLTEWTNKNQQEEGEEISLAERNRDIYIYTGLIGGLFLTTIIRATTFFELCMRASIRLHNRIFARILRAPVQFFDQNPVGRILNRFAKDVGIMDEKLPYIGYDVNIFFGQMLGVVVTISLVNWYLIFPAIVLIGIGVFVRRVYIVSARDLKRFEGIARSPVYSHVSTTINGLVSIRAFGVQASFEQTFYGYLNDHTSTWLQFLATSRMMGMVMEFICAIYIAIVSISVMFMHNIESGTAGLVISSALLLAGTTQWGIRQTAEYENQMISVERIVEYQNLPQEEEEEEEEEVEQKLMDAEGQQWPPTKGCVEFDHFSLAYGPEKVVLHDICFSILEGEKIGIVGRTGAGKSSMISALFRLTEPMQNGGGGTIRIDGIDIFQLRLDDLRRTISIIPQDPVVFTGTVRYNLDPFDEYGDADLWSALSKVQLKSLIDSLPGKLVANLAEGGANLSVGQRQLICLARAILRRNRILVLDEATANVDHQTDALIQRTIRQEFAHCTVLTVAHRLSTIMDCDRVMVLDAGRVHEFDTPRALLQARDSMFYEMCQKTGPTMFARLCSVVANSSSSSSVGQQQMAI